ncbi:MAG TPA: AmmeMemoRadiSam system protein A [Rugosimonospora sp.]|jgi:AmmeMemoRadiSam system protein A|nr:AmmeMemoRadiSam system protein A [Rugosimonospora sp.]
MPPLSDSLLSGADRRALLARARQAILEAVRLRLADLPPAAGRLAEPGGAFVTLLCDGKLRGCIGHTDCGTALAETVVQCATTAALRDPRFKPLRVEELAGLEIEISVVSELRPIRPEELELGVHGIVVIRGASRGLLLPQVAVERNWSATQFLEAACRKAGLEPYGWRDPETKLFAFTAEVFSDASSLTAEEQPAGR